MSERSIILRPWEARAFAELKAARKAAGIKRAVLTRMLGRIKEGKQ